ncbi:MAG TPA: rhomboid family intramembrane serine protease [Phototrophicaceae bacterium]|nr:rhomboid family intramembrane serine protease [Phototrophicaceae bacterium]
MLNDPPPERRKPHPLERQPIPGPPGQGQQPRQQVILHIPSVRPTVTYALIAINVIIFLIRATSFQLDTQILNWGANNSTAVLVNGEVYRLFTSMFLHAGIFNPFGGYALENSLHLIFNMYVLYVVGTQVERLFGHLRFGLIYLLGGLGGSVLSAVLSGPNVVSVGASGAIFSILAAQFVYVYQHRKLLGARARGMMQNLIFLAVVELIYGALTNITGAAEQLDNWAHLGGIIGGLVLTWAIGPIYIVRSHPEHPNELLGEDINPLKNRYWTLSLYVVALMLILIIARTFA